MLELMLAKDSGIMRTRLKCRFVGICLNSENARQKLTQMC